MLWAVCWLRSYLGLFLSGLGCYCSQLTKFVLCFALLQNAISNHIFECSLPLQREYNSFVVYSFSHYTDVLLFSVWMHLCCYVCLITHLAVYTYFLLFSLLLLKRYGLCICIGQQVWISTKKYHHHQRTHRRNTQRPIACIDRMWAVHSCMCMRACVRMCKWIWDKDAHCATHIYAFYEFGLFTCTSQ